MGGARAMALTRQSALALYAGEQLLKFLDIASCSNSMLHGFSIAFVLVLLEFRHASVKGQFESILDGANLI
jgi:hypothetical protein